MPKNKIYYLPNPQKCKGRLGRVTNIDIVVKK
jgi:hypothetical protein